MPSAPRSRLAWWLLVLGRVVLGGIFLFAAYSKLRPPDVPAFTLASLKITGSSLSLSSAMFAMQIDTYRILPASGVVFVSYTLPWFELALALLLLSGLAVRWVSLATTLLVAAFFAVILRSYFAGLEINCGCFGPGAEPLTGSRVLLEVGFLLLAVAVTVGAFFQARSRRTG